jgi:hypothetical protein
MDRRFARAGTVRTGAAMDALTATSRRTSVLPLVTPRCAARAKLSMPTELSRTRA